MTDKTPKQLRNESRKTTRTPDQSRAALRRKVRLFYDFQRLRIQAGGRTYDRATEIELAEVDIMQLEQRSNDLEKVERETLLDIQAHLKTMPVYKQILSDKERFKGIGPTLAGVILAEVDIRRANTVSALWRYAGLAVKPCYRCKSCQDVVEPARDGDLGATYRHAFKRQEKCPTGKFDGLLGYEVYESGRTEHPVKGEKLHYNRFLKTKLLGVMAGCLLKADSPYRKFYDDYKHRLVSAKRGRSDGHRHQMAMRYMVKMLLLDLWVDWRKLEGLEARVPYQEEYLGHAHSA